MAGKPKLTISQAKIIKGKAEGKKQSTIGREVYPNATPASSSVLVSRELKKVNVQEALHMELEKQGITLELAIAPIKKALTAKKVEIHGNGEEAFAEVVEDVDLQLKGSDRALKLMNVGQSKDAPSIHFHQHIEDKKAEYDF